MERWAWATYNYMLFSRSNMSGRMFMTSRSRTGFWCFNHQVTRHMTAMSAVWTTGIMLGSSGSSWVRTSSGGYEQCRVTIFVWSSGQVSSHGFWDFLGSFLSSVVFVVSFLAVLLSSQPEGVDCNNNAPQWVRSSVDHGPKDEKLNDVTKDVIFHRQFTQCLISLINCEPKSRWQDDRSCLPMLIVLPSWGQCHLWLVDVFGMLWSAQKSRCRKLRSGTPQVGFPNAKF